MKTFEIWKSLLKQEIAQAIYDRETEDSKYRLCFYYATVVDCTISELPQKVRESDFFRDRAGNLATPFFHIQAILVHEMKGFITPKKEYTCLCINGRIIPRALPKKTITAAIANAVETWEYEQKGVL